MLNIYELDWKGPLRVSQQALSEVPDKPGVYLFSNSSSPFLVHAHDLAMRSGDPGLAKPRILYVGMTTYSLRHRLHMHSVEPKVFSPASDLFVYWIETGDARELEEVLVSRFKPLFNRDATNGDAGSKNLISAGIEALEALIFQRVDSESEYQKLFIKYPFLLGGIFRKIQSHRKLDDENIPDFTGVRSKDGHLDVIEIKQPFLELSSELNELRCDFHKMWHQAERYLDFVRTESDYLRRQKNLSFDNPYCYLIACHKPTDFLRKEISRKRRVNPGIIHLTYDEILSTARDYQRFVEQISQLST